MAKILVSPMTGTIIPLENVPDEVFSQKILGDGVAIIPDEGTVSAPIDGKIGALLDSFHACGIVTEEKVEILIHVGIDTVDMKGEGFYSHIQKGDLVVKGQKLIDFNIEMIEKAGKFIISPVIVIGKKIKIIASGKIKTGEPLMEME